MVQPKAESRSFYDSRRCQEDSTSKPLNSPNFRRDRSLLASALDRNLCSYALAASSAGVALLACAQPAEATVVATQANIAVPINGGLVQIDINGDGIEDFGFSVKSYFVCPTSAGRYNGGAHPRRNLLCASIGKFSVDPAQAGDEAVAEGRWEGGVCAAAMGNGLEIGSSRKFVPGNLAMGFFSGISAAGTLACNWVGSHPKHYLGVRFTDSLGGLHYGWVRLAVQQFDNEFSATITGYAYETEVDQPITAGAISGPDHADATQSEGTFPRTTGGATLGRLALGAGGLAAWRREGDAVSAGF
jgi:hypothetical protein